MSEIDFIYNVLVYMTALIVYGALAFFGKQFYAVYTGYLEYRRRQ